ncbi:MAG: type 4a pilus biogenesis protein PilO [Elusimicrobia bacterium]|nr:type 4a pilus biogenesis protein PilO [Elusimicrobiota bacterium]
MKKEQQKYIIIGIGFVVFLFIYFKFLVGPVNSGISEKRKKIRELTQTIEQVKIEAAQMEVFKTKLAMLDSEVKDLQDRLPKNKDIPDLIRKISRNAERFGIKIQNLALRSIVTTASPEYDEIPITVQYQASFHTLGHFISDIGQEKRLMSVKDVAMAQSGTLPTQNLSGTFTLTAYMIKGGK